VRGISRSVVPVCEMGCWKIGISGNQSSDIHS
jgi:hypothetical protein